LPWIFPFNVRVQLAGLPLVLAKTSPLVKGDSVDASNTYNGALAAELLGQTLREDQIVALVAA
jgi:hypothetical protein